MPVSTNLFQGNSCYSLNVGVFLGENYMKLHYFVTLHNVIVLCSIYGIERPQTIVTFSVPWYYCYSDNYCEILLPNSIAINF